MNVLKLKLKLIWSIIRGRPVIYKGKFEKHLSYYCEKGNVTDCEFNAIIDYGCNNYAYIYKEDDSKNE